MHAHTQVHANLYMLANIYNAHANMRMHRHTRTHARTQIHPRVYVYSKRQEIIRKLNKILVILFQTTLRLLPDTSDKARCPPKFTGFDRESSQ